MAVKKVKRKFSTNTLLMDADFTVINCFFFFFVVFYKCYIVYSWYPMWHIFVHSHQLFFLPQVLQLWWVCSRCSAGLQQLWAVQRGHVRGGNGWTLHEALFWEPLGGVLLGQGQIGAYIVPPDGGAVGCWCFHRPSHTLSITAKTVWRFFQPCVFSHV